MLTGWVSKALLVFLLMFTGAGLALGQTKSADLPVPQRIQCIPIHLGQAASAENLPDQMVQTITDVIQASRAEMLWTELAAVLPHQVSANQGGTACPSALCLFWLTTGPLGGWFALLH
jgi:hypothetical protein